MRVNVSGIKEEVPLIRFDRLFFEAADQPDSSAVISLREKYPEFTDLFSREILKIGPLTDSAGWMMLKDFVSDSIIRSAKEKTDGLFSENPDFQKELIQAFKHYRYYFPGEGLPEIYTVISGFNESVFISGERIGISLDKYLGTTCEFYPLLGLQLYKQKRMHPEMIPSDVIQAWGRSRFPPGQEATTLCDHMVYEGKLLWFMQALAPDMADSLITGFSGKQSKWCQDNEREMWNYLVENKLLFSTKQMDIVRYIGDGPTTNGFPGGSPARTGAWLGWRIIRNYLKKNPEVTLTELMANTNYQGILNASAYAP
jgi:hypothetical protein